MPNIRNLSHSQIKEFIGCPRKYYIHRILGKDPEFIPSAFKFGGCSHTVLEKINKAIKDDKKIPNPEEVFEKEWNKRDKLPVRFKKGETYKGLKSKIKKLAKTYIEEWKPDDLVMIENKFSMEMFDGLPKIMGIIDAVEKSNDHLILTDYKTSSNKRKPNIQQLTLYKGALVKMGFDPAKIKSRYMILTKTKTPKIYVYDIDIKKKHFERLKSLYHDVYESIMNGCSFPIPSWRCKSCRFSKHCDQIG